jgi:hypothetical protein
MYKENVMRKDNLVTLKGSDVKTFGTDTMHLIDFIAVLN